MKQIKNEVFVLKDPKKAINSVIIVNGSEFPLTKEVHDKLEKLKAASNVYFVFTEGITPNLDRSKFSSLYEASAWIDAGRSLPGTLLRLFEYQKEILNNVGNCILTSTEDLKDINVEPLIQNSQILAMSSISRPVLKIQRLSTDDFYSIYYREMPYSEEPRFSGIFSKFFKKPTIDDKISGMFSSYDCSSRAIFLKLQVINVFLKFQEDDTTRNFIESFEKDKTCIKSFIASLIKHIGMDVIDSDIETINLREDFDNAKVRTEGSK